MAEQAQEVTVTNTGQPQVVELVPVTTYEIARAAVAAFPANQTVTIAPVAD